MFVFYWEQILVHLFHQLQEIVNKPRAENQFKNISF